ncbi:hypothetical protein H0H92_007153, partial [Tricholoma furcatifolium]
DSLDKGVKQKDIPRLLLDEHDITIKLQSVERLIKNHSLRTARHNGLTDVEAAYEPEAVAARHPLTRKVHKHILWSAGPNEEWCVDGHEKLLESMGIAIWGIIDKCSRLELSLTAVPNARKSTVPLSLYLLTARKQHGIPAVVAADKGSELGLIAATQSAMRQMYLPDLDPHEVPPYKAVTSVKNITRERAWRPLLEKVLRNIQHFYISEKLTSGYHPNDQVHRAISLWLWAQIVQTALDAYMEEQAYHTIRKQKKSQLPTGGRPIDFYKHPERWSLADCIVKVPDEDMDRLIAEHVDHGALQFGNDETVGHCKALWCSIGSPNLAAIDGWKIFGQMIRAAVAIDVIVT